MQFNNNAIIIFIKNAVAGKVKTRLAKNIGNNAALKVYKNLLDITRTQSSLVDAKRYLFYSNNVVENDNWSIALFHKVLQSGKDLGEKMKNAFDFSFKEKHKKVLIIGSDCPSISNEIIESAFTKLDQYDFVIGPAKDGGYYLFAMKALNTFVFDNKNWSTETLLKETIAAIEDKKLTYALLEELNDIDTIEDLMEYDNGKSNN